MTTYSIGYNFSIQIHSYSILAYFENEIWSEWPSIPVLVFDALFMTVSNLTVFRIISAPLIPMSGLPIIISCTRSLSLSLSGSVSWGPHDMAVFIQVKYRLIWITFTCPTELWHFGNWRRWANRSINNQYWTGDSVTHTLYFVSEFPNWWDVHERLGIIWHPAYWLH